MRKTSKKNTPIRVGIRRYEAVPQSDGTFAVCKRQKRYDYILDTVCWCTSLTAAKRLAARLQKLDEIEALALRGVLQRS